MTRSGWSCLSPAQLDVDVFMVVLSVVLVPSSEIAASAEEAAQ